VDNCPDQSAKSTCEAFHPWCHYLPAGRNLGVGAGLNLGLGAALRAGSTYIITADDDAVFEKDSVKDLKNALDSCPKAAFSVPMIYNSEGRPDWAPGFVKRHEKREYLHNETVGTPLLDWVTGICVCWRSQLLQNSNYREDFWAMGEDIEFSLRQSRVQKGMLSPAIVHHLPPGSKQPGEKMQTVNYVKHLALVQNVVFIALHTPHGRKLFPSLPGLIYHYLKKSQGQSGSRKMQDLLFCLHSAAVAKQPAGGERFTTGIRKKLLSGF